MVTLKVDESEFIPHHGGESPVPDSQIVLCKHRDGRISASTAICYFWEWGLLVPQDDVLWYMPIQIKVKSKKKQKEEKPPTVLKLPMYRDRTTGKLVRTENKSAKVTVKKKKKKGE